MNIRYPRRARSYFNLSIIFLIGLAALITVGPLASGGHAGMKRAHQVKDKERAAGGDLGTAFKSGSAATIQSGVQKIETAPQSLQQAQTVGMQGVGEGPFKPYTSPPKPDRSNGPALPGSDLVEFSAPRKLSKGQENLLGPLVPVSTFTIVIVPGPGLQANTAALAAFNAAAASWAARFTDPILVTIEADMAPLGSGIIGSTSAVSLQANYNTIRNAVVADANTSVSASDNIATSLPTAAQFGGTVPAGFGFDGNLVGTKANLKALGFTGLDAPPAMGGFGPSDGNITFSTNFSFDYNRADGVSPGTIDFQTVAAHEIGHLLGFVSVVDDVDDTLPNTANIEPTTLDLFRFKSDNLPTTPATFTSVARNFVPGHSDVTSDTVTSPLMSTGLANGDGRQASHWKDDISTGVLIGIMDPTLDFATIEDVSETDIHAFDLIGYDVNSVPVGSTTPNPAVTNEDTAIQITLTGTDADDNNLTFTVTDAPDQGSLSTISAPDCSATNSCTATVTYTPNPNFNGADSFKFKVNDGTADSAEATVNITVNAVNDPPAITAASGLSRQQGSAAVNSQIATVTDDGGNGGVAVTVISANPSNGVNISNIVNTGGVMTADIIANCSASNTSFTLQASDGSLTATGTLNIAVTPNTPPTLSYTNPPALAFKGSTTVSPATATDNGSITGYTVQSVVPALTTAPTVDASGVVSITNAQPAGPHTITIRATDNCTAITDASFTLTVNKGNQSITVNTHAPANASYNAGFTVAAASDSGLPVTYSSAGACTNVGATFTMTSSTGTCTVKYDQAGDSNYNAATQLTESVTAQKANQAISVNTHAPANLTYNTSFTVTATSNSALAVAYSSAGVCTNMGATFTMTSGTGTCTVKYDQAGDTNYNVATQVTESVTAQKANQTITANPHAPANATYNTSFMVGATSNSSLAVTFSSAGVCTNANTTFTMTSGTGTCTVEYDQAGDGNYNVATQVTESVTAQKANQTITANPHAPANATYNTSFTVGATSNSSLAVTFSSAGVCTNANTTFTMTSGTGTCTVKYDQAGDGNYNVAQVTESVAAQKANQTITFGSLANKSFGDPDFNVSATASSNLTTSFAASGQCSVTGSTVHLTSAGSCTITASQTGNANFSSAPDVLQSFNIAKAPTATAVSSSVNPSDFGQGVTFTATVSSALGTATGTVQFKDGGANLGAPVALTGGVAQLSTSSLASANHSLTADYSGDLNFANSTGTLPGGQVVKAQPTLSINDVLIAEGDSGTTALSFTVALSAASNLTVKVDFATANGTASAPSDYLTTNGTLTFSPGDLTKTVSVTINGDVSFETDETFTVNLTNAVNAGISKATGIGTIRNDDPAGGVIALTKTDDTVSEATGFITVTIVRTKDVSQAVNVDYATDDTGAAPNCATLNSGLASSRCDFMLMLGTLNFAANETQKTVDIPINRDGHQEGPETFKFVLSNPTGAAILGTASSLNITITDSAVPSTNAIDDTELFVRQQYHDFLNREPDAAGLAFWKDNIDKCMDPTRLPAGQTVVQCIETQRIITSAAFFLSIEFRQTGGLVRDFYVAALNRPATNNMPDYVEFMRDTQAIQVVVGQGNWQQVLDANRLAFMNEFVVRAEFVALYPTTDTPTQYVDKLYLHANVTPAPQERLDAIAEFGGAATAANAGARGRALLRITQSAAFQTRELNRAFVQMEYLGYLRRNPNAPPDNNFNGYDFWLNKLTQFNGDFLKAEMVKAFLSSGEYRTRFGP